MFPVILLLVMVMSPDWAETPAPSKASVRLFSTLTLVSCVIPKFAMSPPEFVATLSEIVPPAARRFPGGHQKLEP